MQARLRSPYVSSRRRESTKLCCDFAVYITAIIIMLITILLMTEDRCNTSFANKCLHILFTIGDENVCKTNSVFYFTGSVFYYACCVLNYRSEITMIELVFVRNVLGCREHLLPSSEYALTREHFGALNTSHVSSPLLAAGRLDRRLLCDSSERPRQSGLHESA